jgi:hypothetical protein
MRKAAKEEMEQTIVAKHGDIWFQHLVVCAARRMNSINNSQLTVTQSNLNVVESRHEVRGSVLVVWRPERSGGC